MTWSRHVYSPRTAWAVWLAIAAVTSAATPSTGFAQNVCDNVVPVQDVVELYSTPSTTASLPRPIDKKRLGTIKCLGEKDGLYHIRWGDVEGWVPTWELAKTGPQDPLQPLLRPPKKESAAPLARGNPAPSSSPVIAVSPSQGREQPGKLESQPGELKDLLRKAPPDAEDPPKGAR